MNERKNRGDRSPQRRPSEGVRIIRADEAQAALDAGEAAGRRPDHELRFGDVPPAPSGPRPPHRFPLPISVDPAEAVPLPPLASASGADEQSVEDEGELSTTAGTATWGGLPAAAPVPVGSTGEEWGIGDRTAEFTVSEAGGVFSVLEVAGAFGGPEGAGGSVPLGAQASDRREPPNLPEPPGGPETAGTGGLPADEPTAAGPTPAGPTFSGTPTAGPTTEAEAMPLAPPEEGITVTGGGTDLPHWTDPPTGEVPLILPDDGREEESGDDDLEAWKALGSRGTRWRDDAEDWADVDEIGELAGDVPPVGALDQTRSEQSDLYSFDEEFERVQAERSGAVPVLADFHDEYEPETAGNRSQTAAAASASAAAASASPRARARTGAHGPSSRLGRGGPPGQGGEDDLVTRVVVGVGLIVLLVLAYAVGSKALVVLSAAVVVAAAAEAYGMLQRSGFRPATLLGLVAALGLVFGAYWKGIEALPLAVVLVFAGSMTWYLLRIVEARPLANVAVTTTAFVWVGLFGSYSAVMLRASHGKGLLLGAILVTVAADIGGFVVGRWIGSRPIAPSVSPSKTVEGLVGGLIAAVIVGAIVGKELTPWGGIRHGLILGVIIGFVAPAGDLFESMIKRDLGVKDSGSALPGHGGLLDRFDSLLLALPAAYYLATLFDIVK